MNNAGVGALTLCTVKNIVQLYCPQSAFCISGLTSMDSPNSGSCAAKSLQSCPTPRDPIDGSPPRLPHPWDSPGKNTGVGCHFLLQCMKVKSKSEVAQSRPTLSDPMDCSLPGSSLPGILQARVLEWGAIAFSTLLYFYWGKKIHISGPEQFKPMMSKGQLYFAILFI